MSNTPPTPHITDLRRALLDTLADLRNRENPMEPDRARAVAQVASVLIDSARVEVEFLRVTSGDRSSFLGTPEKTQETEEGGGQRLQGAWAGGSTVHRLKG